MTGEVRSGVACMGGAGWCSIVSGGAVRMTLWLLERFRDSSMVMVIRDETEQCCGGVMVLIYTAVNVWSKATTSAFAPRAQDERGLRRHERLR